MRTDRIKNEINEIRKQEEKIEEKDLKYKTNIYIIFKNLKQYYLMIVLTLVKLVQMKLRWIKPIYQKIW